MPENEREAGAEAARAIVDAGIDLADQAIDKLYQGTKKESLADKMARAEKQHQEQLAAHQLRQLGGLNGPSLPGFGER